MAQLSNTFLYLSPIREADCCPAYSADFLQNINNLFSMSWKTVKVCRLPISLAD